jgi:glycosyltransferase involved in cell wall biosynthesis
MQKLSIIIPVYNEKKTILIILDKVNKADILNLRSEIIIVDDFSTDGTREVVKNIRDKNIKIIYHNDNKGKGSAIRAGLKQATGDIVLIQDADLEYDPRDYKKLLDPILRGNAQVVYGSRFEVIRKNLSKMYKLHYIGNMFLTFITNILYGVKISDMETCYKVFRKEVIKGISLKATRFDFEPEITAKILKKGYNIHEVPIRFYGRKFNEGKKITWVDGVKAIYYLVKYRFSD